VTLLLLLPAILSLLALGAHLFRAGNWLGLAFIALLMGLLAVRKPLSARIVPLALLFGVAEWIRTAVRIGSARAEQGQPWMRMAIILGAVALVTGLAVIPFRSRRLKRWFGADLPA
jgi:vacuolar-type H+-ATPase subunit I/STV1